MSSLTNVRITPDWWIHTRNVTCCEIHMQHYESAMNTPKKSERNDNEIEDNVGTVVHAHADSYIEVQEAV